MTTTEKEPFRSHALLELMGHRRVAGFVEEVELAGTGFLRVSVPDTPRAKGFTQLLSPKSVYAITPLGSAEDAARIAATCRPEPFQPWEIPGTRSDPREHRAIAGPRDSDDDDDEYDEDDADGDDDLADVLEDLAEQLPDDDDDLDAVDDALEGETAKGDWQQKALAERAGIIELLGLHDAASLRALVRLHRRGRLAGPLAVKLVEQLEQVARDSCFVSLECWRPHVAMKIGLALGAEHFTVDVVRWICDELGVLPYPREAGPVGEEIPF